MQARAPRFSPWTHITVLAIKFHTKPLHHKQPNLSGLLDAAVRVAKSGAESASKVKQLVMIPNVEGKKKGRGLPLSDGRGDFGAGVGWKRRL